VAFLHQSIFYEMAALLALASLVGVLGLLLRQPLIVSFIAVGIIAGPDMLGPVHSTEHIELLAEIGIAVLHFRLSLLRSLRDAGFTGRIALTSTDSVDARHLLQVRADVVLSPFKDAASRAVERIVEALDRTNAPDKPQDGALSRTHMTTSQLSQRL
jgi:hypothetical protein